MTKTTTYQVCDNDGYPLTDGLQEHEAARVAQRMADTRGDSVWLSKSGSEQLGTEYTPTDRDARECECGRATGVPCAGQIEDGDAVILEWMPEHLRASHLAANNRGVYPHNGAERLRVTRDCAQAIIESDGDWAEIVSEGVAT